MGEERAPSPATDVNHEDDLERQHDTNPLQPVSEEKTAEDAKAREDRFDKWCIIVVIALIVFFGLFALITWLAIRPVQAARYSIDGIQIKAFAMNATDSTLAASFAYNVSAHNENHKMGFKYDWITIDASYRGENFGRSSIGGFKQGKSSITNRTAEFSVQSFALPQNVADSLSFAIRNGSVPLRVYAKAKLHGKIGKYVSFPLSVDVDCRLLVAPPSLTMAGKVLSKACRLTRPPYKKAKKFKTYKAPVPYRRPKL